MKKTALIMAGGKGERFWPRSRADMPKQFLPLTEEGRTMIQLAVERILPLVDPKDVFIITNRHYRDLTREQLPGLPEENILCEPTGKNTAPCIGLGAVHIREKYGDAIMYVLPSDHMITDPKGFRAALSSAALVAEQNDNLVTVGITPAYPETGYGYIRFDPERRLGGAFAVERFVEKPGLETAREYVASQRYLWNSGMFIWKASSILRNFREIMPDTWAGLERIGAAIGTDGLETVLEEEFNAFKAESVDYGIMEKARGIYTVPGAFGWDDVGSWLAVGRFRQEDGSGNVLTGNVVAVDSKNTIIQGEKKLIAAVGLEDLIIVDTEDATLICSKNSTGSIRKVLEELRLRGRTEYL